MDFPGFAGRGQKKTPHNPPAFPEGLCGEKKRSSKNPHAFYASIIRKRKAAVKTVFLKAEGVPLRQEGKCGMLNF